MRLDSMSQNPLGHDTTVKDVAINFSNQLLVYTLHSCWVSLQHNLSEPELAAHMVCSIHNVMSYISS